MAQGRRLRVIKPDDFKIPEVDESGFRQRMYVGMCRVVHYDLDTMVRLRDTLIREGFNAEAFHVYLEDGEIKGMKKQA